MENDCAAFCCQAFRGNVHRVVLRNDANDYSGLELKLDEWHAVGKTSTTGGKQRRTCRGNQPLLVLNADASVMTRLNVEATLPRFRINC